MPTTRVTFPSPAEGAGRAGTAWAASLAVHAAALAVLLRSMQPAHIVPLLAPAPLIYVEPAPVPPAPPGVPAGHAAAPPVTEPLKDVVREPPKPVEPVIEKRHPLRAPPPRPAASYLGVPRGQPLGELGGVTEGVAGGMLGGVPGGRAGGKGEVPVPADRVAHPPVPIEKVLPTYPPMARVRGVEGVVLLRAVVDREGRVEDGVAVVESSPTFDDAAVTAFRRWRFQPGSDEDGTAVRVVLEVPIRFQLR